MCPKVALLHALQEIGSFVLASPEDADYFRKTKPVKKVEPAPVIRAPKPIVAPPPVIKAPKAPIETKPLRQTTLIEPPSSSFDGDFYRYLLKKIAPQLAILDKIPSDEIARKLESQWKTKNQIAPITILSLNEPEEQKRFLEAIAMALDLYFGPVRIVQAQPIESERQWDTFLSSETLKTVIVCDYTLWQLSSLMQFYRETPAQNTRMLKNTPVFLLPDLSLYLKDFSLKRSLWKALCQKFS